MPCPDFWKQLPSLSNMPLLFSTILAIELLQAPRDSAIASSKLLMDHSWQAFRNTPINSQVLLDNKIKEVAKSNFETQQHRFLASSTNSSAMQPMKTPYTSTGSFTKSKPPTKSFRPKSNQPYKPRSQSQSFAPSARKDFPSWRTSNSRQFPSSRPASSSTKFCKPSLSTACLTTSRYSGGRKIGPLCRILGRNNS